MPTEYQTKEANSLRRREVVEARIAEAIGREAIAATAKEIAADAEISVQRAKQIKGEAGDPRASTLILLAQRRPELRSLLIDFMHAEMGDGERSPAQILDAIARMIR